MRVRTSNDLIHWVRFFLNGLTQAAVKGRDSFRQILSLRTEVERALGVSTPTARTLIKALIERHVLVEITGQQRGRMYAFDRYPKLFTSQS